MPSASFDPHEMLALGRRLAPSYRNASPWPHVVLDDLVGLERSMAVETAELPFARQMQAHRDHRLIKSESPVPGSGAARDLLAELSTSAFIRFVEELTGISNLIDDPTHYWGGIYAAGPGSFHAVHSDFARHPKTHLYHRVNVLIYLNSAWEDHFRGELELWSRDLNRCERRITPVAGRIVIFESSGDNYHGLPEPLATPPDRLRLALAAHYYTLRPPDEMRREPILRRPRRSEDPWWLGYATPRQALGMVRAKVLERRNGSSRGQR